MLTRNKPVKPGSFDYLLDGMDTEAPPRVTAPPRVAPPPVLRARREGVGSVPVVPPPAPPERDWGGNNPRIHVEIEITERRLPQQVQRAGYRFGSFTAWLIAAGILLSLAGCGAAHAQGVQWETHKNGFVTESHGTSPAGQWVARSYRQGFNTLTDIQRPDGSTGHCTSYQQGWQTITNCD